jgi:hypothetical protein
MSSAVLCGKLRVQSESKQFFCAGKIGASPSDRGDFGWPEEPS